MEDIIMWKKRTIIYATLTAFFSIILISCLKEEPLKVPFQSYSPANLGDGWEIAEPAEAGIDGEALKEVYRYVHKDDNVWQIRSLLVFRNNKLVAESYMKDPDDQTNLHPIWSCTKQVIGILTGIAIDKGLISIEDKISDFFPNAPSNKKEISIEELLTMKSGINYNNDGYNGEDCKLAREEPSNSLDFVLGLEMHSTPGTSYRYKNSDPHLLSAIIQEKVGKTTRDWAKEVLFDKIGITRLEWRTYKDGITFGGFGILTTPREMGKIGQLVANNGMWNGEQIVSKNWIDEMTTVRTPAGETDWQDNSFGYLWWINTARNVMFMAGHGGQFVLINKDKNLIVVITSERHPAGDFSLLPHEALSIYDRINSIAK
ncbi:MAG: beta-lactamase family protein [Dysgonamonadaceae bacterium]|jgi:CubicO group peptidase (beta-lactamase class C family)|nr:beta-lactamase family protein [Dysgonamonadaceae bacterium]